MAAFRPQPRRPITAGTLSPSRTAISHPFLRAPPDDVRCRREASTQQGLRGNQEGLLERQGSRNPVGVVRFFHRLAVPPDLATSGLWHHLENGVCALDLENRSACCTLCILPRRDYWWFFLWVFIYGFPYFINRLESLSTRVADNDMIM